MNASTAITAGDALAPGRRREPAAFTLIELLVVITIVVLLIAILLPVLKHARETTEAARCLTGVRQNVAAVLLYAQDHRDRFPEYKSAYNHNPSDYVRPDICDNLLVKETLGSYLNIADYSTFDGVAGRVLCPENKIIYYYNEHLLGSDGHGNPGNRWGPSTPGSTIMVASVLKPSTVSWGGDFQLNQNELFGHLGRRNVSFVDGHAEPVLDEDRQDKLWGDVFDIGVKPVTWPY